MAANRTKAFLCGVVEGFYGRPWTMTQRYDLFTMMSQLRMNAYLYAPKDDDKHRAIWRELYSYEEADHLTTLIRETHSKGIEFVYAIAPGLDITFSDNRDILALKQKLNQVLGLGCRSFAILFDDIDPDLVPVDAKVFASSAHAQVAISNEIYQHLQEPQIFLFCPTEYCGSRAVPSVSKSQYLNHIGEALHPNIDIMWTGPKVISKTISLASIEELTEVIRRPPVIWDNLHANDYDQRRLFLGPYQGRSTSLIPKLNGVLTNPNCEFSANFVAIHTLAQWSRMAPKHESPDNGEEVMEGDEKDFNIQGPLEGTLYNPHEALDMALAEWLKEFHTSQRKLDDYQPSKSSKSIAQATEMEHTSSEALDRGMDRMCEDDIKERASSAGSSDMDTTLETEELQGQSSISIDPPSSKTNQFMMDDLRILVDFFYLPHTHGDRGNHIIDEFCWLKHNAPPTEQLKSYAGNRCGSRSGSSEEEDHIKKFGKIKVQGESDGEGSDDPYDDGKDDAMEVIMWLERAESFHTSCEEVNTCFNRLTAIGNRPLLYDVYQYMSDARETTMLLDSYISWLEAGGSEAGPKHQPHSKMGGIVAEMLRLLPQVDRSDKLYRRRRAPGSPAPRTFIIRPYFPEDKALLYKTCLETGNNGEDATDMFHNYPDVLGDRFVGPYLELSRDLSFVLEDNEGVCGYVLATQDSFLFYEQLRSHWLAKLEGKYPSLTPRENATAEEEMVMEIYHPKLFLPDTLQKEFPSHLHIDIMKRAQGQGNGPRMIKTILSILKAKGSHGVHLEMSSHNKRALKFYLKLGFYILDYGDHPDLPKGVLILGRTL